MKKLLLSFILLFSCASAPVKAVDFKEIELALTGTGLTGWIHGKNVSGEKGGGLLVFTYRNPTNFFDNVQMTILSDNAALISVLNSLDRHDKIKIKGKFLPNPSPQKHILVSEVVVVQKFTAPITAQPHEYEAKLPEELMGGTSVGGVSSGTSGGKAEGEAIFLVHAITGDGKALILEFKDTVVPVFVKDATLTKDLYRNDIVKVKYTIQRSPGAPTHLQLKTNLEPGEKSIELLESALEKHGKKAVVEGHLILFPKSPEIIFNVFAVEEPARDGLTRQYTLVNFDSPEEFKKIREKLQTAWDLHSASNDFINARNKFKNLKVRVKVTGLFNEVDKNQANIQILLKDANSIEILE